MRRTALPIARRPRQIHLKRSRYHFVGSPGFPGSPRTVTHLAASQTSLLASGTVTAAPRRVRSAKKAG